MTMLLAGARPAVAAEADAPVVGALLRFVDALESGDAGALEKMVSAVTPIQEQSRKTFVDLASSQKALEKSALKRFGEEGKMFRCNYELIFGGADRRTIQSAKVNYDEPIGIARIEKAGEMAPMTLRRNQDSQWQVVLEYIDWEDDAEHYYGPPGFPQPGSMRQAALAAIKVARYSATIAAFKETQARIDGGELASAVAAHAELMGKLTAASAEAVRARAAVPSNRALKERP
jgi:hypothetical protein